MPYTWIALILFLAGLSFPLSYYVTQRYIKRELTRFPNQPEPADHYEKPEESIKAFLDPKLPGCVWFEGQLGQMEHWFIRSADGLRLHAWYLPVAGAKACALISHGHGDTPGKIALYARYFAESGRANCLLIDHRTHGLSEGRSIAMGVAEAKDILLWTKEICARLGVDTPIYWIGWSMGAAAVLLNSDCKLPPVKAIVADSPFRSIYTQSLRITRHWGLRQLLKLLLPLCFFYIKKDLGYNFFKGNVLAHIRRCDYPLLMFHGEEDRLVPSAMGEALYRAAKGPKRFVLVKGARHVWGIMEQPGLFQKELDAFFNSLSDKPSASAQQPTAV